MRSVPPLRVVVVIPAGPGATATDTLQSVFRYADPELVVVIDDTRGRGINFRREKVVVMPAVAHGGQGELWVNLAQAFRYLAGNSQFDILLRIDTDALLLGSGLAAAAAAKFHENPKVGVLGACRFGCDGAARDWTPARKIFRAETGPRGLRHPALRRTLRGLLAAASGYTLGEHALGGAVLYRGEAVRAMRRQGLLDFPEFVDSRLGEDHIFGLIAAVAGYRTDDFSRPGDPMAVRWKGLPLSPEALLKKGKLVTHSIRSWDGMSEQEIRDYFAATRS